MRAPLVREQLLDLPFPERRRRWRRAASAALDAATDASEPCDTDVRDAARAALVRDPR